MITPILLNRLAWKGYLIFMAMNFLFVPLVYFCYPETANLTLEEIDYIFEDKTKNSVKWSIEMRKQKLQGGRSHSFVDIGGVERRRSNAGAGVQGDDEGTLRGSHDEGKRVTEHSEKV